MNKNYTIEDILSNGGKLSEIINNYKQRDGQIKMSKYIDDGYKNDKTVIINAPTGNGKSIGGLVPAILNKDKGQTIISTATKSLQSQYADKDLPMLHKILDFTSHVLKGRDNYICNNKFESNGKTVIPSSLYDDVKSWYLATELGDFEELSFVIPQSVKSKISSNSDDCLEADCPYKNRCFYAKNKAKASESDIVVINHDLLALSLMLKTKYHVPMFGDANAIIIDEAHKLEDVMTKYLGFKMNSNSCKTFVSNSKKHLETCIEKHISKKETLEEVSSLCDSLMYSMVNLFENFVIKEEKTYRIYSNKLDTSLCVRIKTLISTIFNKLPNADQYSYTLNDKDRNRYNMIKKRLRDLDYKFDMLIKIDSHIEEFVYYVDACEDVRQITLTVSPIDISNDMNKMLFNRKVNYEDGDIRTVVLMSATLFVNKSFSFVKDRLGIQETYSDCEESCLLELSIPDMFDYKHQALLYIPKGIVEPSNNTKDKQVFTNQLIKTFKDLSNIVDGGILGLFTSYSEMDKVYNGLIYEEYSDNDIVDEKGRQILNQRLMPRPKLIQTFKEFDNAILLGTSSLWEGIDIQGKSCSCVVIDRLPFPIPTEPIIEARIDKLKNAGRNWFEEYYLPMMTIALQQGFGRLIRTHKDLGMIVLMDNRVLTKGYGRKVLNSLPKCLKTRKITKVRIFWDIVRRKRELRSRSKHGL